MTPKHWTGGVRTGQGQDQGGPRPPPMHWALEAPPLARAPPGTCAEEGRPWPRGLWSKSGAPRGLGQGPGLTKGCHHRARQQQAVGQRQQRQRQRGCPLGTRAVALAQAGGVLLALQLQDAVGVAAWAGGKPRVVVVGKEQGLRHPRDRSRRRRPAEAVCVLYI